MKLNEYRFLADENIQPEVVAFLRNSGCDIIDARSAKLLGVEDVEIVRAAWLERRVILTHDADFGRIGIEERETLVGIIYIRPGHSLPAFTIESLQVIQSQSLDPKPPFLLVADRRGALVRIRLRNL